MATSTLAPTGKQYFWNVITGAPLAGGYVYTFLAGTTTPQTTYQDAAGLIPNSNPIVLNSAGYAVIYFTLGASYKLVVTDGVAAFPVSPSSIVGTIQWTQDTMLAVPAAAPAFDITGIAGVNIAVNQACYLSDGSAGLNAGQWYLADSSKSYSSLTPLIGFATSAIAAGSVGSFRLSGQLSGFSALVGGAAYYVGTAGAITTTAPASSRYVGQADTTVDLVISADPPGLNPTIDVGICDGRLTLTTGVPVPTVDVTAATNVFFTPFKGNRIALWDGVAAWTLFTFSEITLALGTIAAGVVFDVMAFNNNGAVGLVLLQWTNSTTRSVALTMQDGVLIQMSTTRRYLGTLYTTSATTTEDSGSYLTASGGVPKRYLWNYYHRVDRPVARIEATTSWTYSTNTIRQANAAAANQIEVVIGISEEPIDLSVMASFAVATNPNTAAVGIGLDSTTTFAADQIIQVADMVPASSSCCLLSRYRGYPGIGRHVLSWNEVSFTAGATTWYGSATNVNSVGVLAAGTKSGILGSVKG